MKPKNHWTQQQRHKKKQTIKVSSKSTCAHMRTHKHTHLTPSFIRMTQTHKSIVSERKRWNKKKKQERRMKKKRPTINPFTGTIDTAETNNLFKWHKKWEKPFGQIIENYLIVLFDIRWYLVLGNVWFSFFFNTTETISVQAQINLVFCYCCSQQWIWPSFIFLIVGRVERIMWIYVGYCWEKQKKIIIERSLISYIWI